MTRARQDLLLGLVFFTGLTFLLWATFKLSGFTLEPPDEHRAFFENAVGLREGDTVFVLGHRVGQVKEIDYRGSNERDARIAILMSVKTAIAFRTDYRITIQEGSLLGGKLIEIDPGTSPDLLPAGTVLIGRVRPSGIEALGQLLDDPQIKADFKNIVAGISKTFDNLNASDTSIGKLFTESLLYDELLGTFSSGRRSLEELEKGTGGLGRLIYDPNVGDDVVSITGDVADMVANARAGRGAVGRLLSDPETERKLDEILDGFADVANKASDPEAGLIGELLGGQEMRDDAIAVFDDLSDVTNEIRNGNGIANRVVYDEDMGEQLERILNQVSRAIEDAREAAPIGTFFTVFSGAF